jgi:hypothetical protein
MQHPTLTSVNTGAPSPSAGLLVKDCVVRASHRYVFVNMRATKGPIINQPNYDYNSTINPARLLDLAAQYTGELNLG